MLHTHSRPHEPCPACVNEPVDVDCGTPFGERNRYFDGKLMVARDFSDEQRYYRSLSMTHNRHLHGEGIVCGFETECHPEPSCRPNWIVVRSGLAVDCCGRYLYLPKDTPLELGLPIAPRAAGEAPPVWERFLAARYCESPVEYLPALYSEATCDGLRREASRLREGVSLSLLEPHEVPDRCWPREEPVHDPGIPDDAGGTAPGRSPVRDTGPGRRHGPHHWEARIVHEGATAAHNCTELRPHGRTPECARDCPCGHYMILARLTWSHERGLVVDMRHRRVLPAAAGRLTSIVRIGWPHGGELPVADLSAESGRLQVWFSRPIRETTAPGTGINPFTFQVQYVQSQRTLEFLDYAPASPPGLDGPYRAVYTVDPRYFTGRNRDALVNATVWVTIHGNFVIDDQNNPADLDFLRGELPTGDGVPGGTFSSWFRIVR